MKIIDNYRFSYIIKNVRISLILCYSHKEVWKLSIKEHPMHAKNMLLNPKERSDRHY